MRTERIHTDVTRTDVFKNYKYSSLSIYCCNSKRETILLLEQLLRKGNIFQPGCIIIRINYIASSVGGFIYTVPYIVPNHYRFRFRNSIGDRMLIFNDSYLIYKTRT